jgi:hypothetical protein
MRLSDRSDEQLWTDLVEADRNLIGRRVLFFNQAHNAVDILRRALLDVAERGTALRYLEAVHRQDLRRAVLPELLSLAAVTHSDTVLARSVIATLKNEPWFASEVKRLVQPILAQGSDEEYRRIAELYAETNPELLDQHLQACAESNDPEIIEIARDYEDD